MIALFGGSFDPIHEGHAHVVASLAEGAPWNKLYVMPTSQNPAKAEPPRASAVHRRAMVEASVAALPGVGILDWELELPGPGFTVDTVARALRELDPEVVLVLGADAWQGFTLWREPRKILENAHVLVVSRDGSEPPAAASVLGAVGISGATISGPRTVHSKSQRWIEIRRFPALPWSSSSVRESIARAWKQSPLVCPGGVQPAVWDIISRERLYTA